MSQSLRGFLLAAVLLGAAKAGFAQAKPTDAGPAKEGITLLGAYPAEVDRITTAISQVSFPTGGVSYECTYPPAGRAAMYVRDHTLRYSSRVSFAGLDAELQPKIQVVQTYSRQFATKFEPLLRHWAQTTLPQSSGAFDGASAEVQAVQNEMKKGIGPNEQQRTRVIAALDRILGILRSGQGELVAMTNVLSPYLQQQRAARGSLSGWSSTATSQAQSRAQEIRQEINTKRCKGDGLQQVDRLLSSASGSIAAITGNIQELERRDADADKALSIVLGTFVGYTSRYGAVADRLKVVKEAPLGSTIQGLHLAVAASLWQDLVTTAKNSGL